MPYVNDTKPSVATGTDIFVGNPIGLTLVFTYAANILVTGERYTNDSEPSSSYSNASKPTTSYSQDIKL